MSLEIRSMLAILLISEFLFMDTSYNHPLESWDVSHVTNMQDMFYVPDIIIR